MNNTMPVINAFKRKVRLFFYAILPFVLCACLQNEITLAPDLFFNKLTAPHSPKGAFDSAAILKNVQGIKSGYSLQEIKDIKPSGVVKLTGAAPNFSLSFQKVGQFTATLVLKHPNKEQAVIKKATFEITKAKAESLGFDKLSKPYTVGAFTHAEIVGNLTGAKTGYVFKQIKIVSNPSLAKVEGTAPNFKISFLKVGRFQAALVLEHPFKEDVTVNNAVFEITKTSSPLLTFSKLTKIYVGGGRFTASEILANVGGTKTGYALKAIQSLAPVGVVALTGTAPSLSLSYRTVGSFAATLILAHPTKADATITGARFEIKASSASVLGFNPLIKSYADARFTTAAILANITGGKAGYALKEIKALNPLGMARVTGDAPNLKMDFQKVGAFTATLVLKHATKADATITGARFEITRATAPSLTFPKLIKTYTLGGRFWSLEILNNITGAKTGYTLKEIKNLSTPDVVRISGVAPNTKLDFKKSGTFTADLVLQHPTKADATITGAQFEVLKSASPILTFVKLIKSYREARFDTNAILNNILGPKTGYTLKEIKSLSPNDIVRVSGVAPDFKLDFQKAGQFKADLVLQHSNKADVTIAGALFEVLKLPKESLVFSKLSKPYQSGGSVNSFTSSEVLANITGTKAGYTLKSIVAPIPADIVHVTGVAPNLKMDFQKVGAFTATLVLAHPYKSDVTLTVAPFEVARNNRELLTFDAISKPFSALNFTTADVLNNIRGTKAGYTLKSIAMRFPTDVVRVTGVAPNLKIDFQKVGSFTAILSLQHPTKDPVVITDAQFTIVKSAKASLRFTKLARLHTTRRFTAAQILGNVVGDKAGYRLKSIAAISPNAIVSLSGSAPNFQFDFKKGGSFTATLVLEHPTKADETITNAPFEVLKTPAAVLTFAKLTQQYRSGGHFDKVAILANVGGRKTDYTLKAITSLSPNDVVDVSGSTPNLQLDFKKAGAFTATLILEHPTKKDAVIRNAQFEVTKTVAATGLTFDKLTKTYVLGGKFNPSEILANVKGAKTGYTLKSASNSSDVLIGFPLGSVVNFVKVGVFTATLVLEHPYKADVSIPNAQFEITKAASESLTFDKLASPLAKFYALSGQFTFAEIMANVKGNAMGYAIKSITGISDGSVASVDGKNIKFKKAGTFTATLVLAHTNKQDVTLSGAKFAILKTAASVLTFTKLSKTYRVGGQFTTAEIFNNVVGIKTGYKIKAISAISDSTVAAVNGKNIDFKKAGTFTATLVLAHDTKVDAEILLAEFEITP